jgi:hypothetical protein
MAKPYSAAGIRSILKRHGDVTPYQLRHTFGQLASEQLSEQDVAALMGHTDVETTRRYFEVKSARARAKAKCLVLPQVALSPAALAPPRPSKNASAPSRKKKPLSKNPRHRPTPAELHRRNVAAPDPFANLSGRRAVDDTTDCRNG